MCVPCELAAADWHVIEQYVAYDMSDQDVQAALLARLGDEADGDTRAQVARLNSQNARELLFDSLRSANLCTPDQASLCLGNEAKDHMPLSRIFASHIDELVRTIDLEVTRDAPAMVEARMRKHLVERSLIAWLTEEGGYPIGLDRLSVTHDAIGWRAELSASSERWASLLAQLEYAVTRAAEIKVALSPRKAREATYGPTEP